MVFIAMMKCWHFPVRRFSTIRQTCTYLQQQGFMNVPYSKSTSHYKATFDPFLVQNRKLSEESHNSKEKVTLSVNPYSPEEGFAQIYKFPYIAHTQALCRVKILQTVFTAIFIPCLYVFSPASASPEQFPVIVGLGAFACLMLGVMGEIFRKFVGIIYYNPNKKQVCVAHLTFWGDRCNSYFDADDIVPFGDFESNLSDIYLKLRFYSKPSLSYWITLRYGRVIDKDHFFEVFRCLPSEERD